MKGGPFKRIHLESVLVAMAGALSNPCHMPWAHLWLQPQLWWTVPHARQKSTSYTKQATGKGKRQSAVSPRIVGCSPMSSSREKAWVSRSHPAHSWPWLNYNPRQNEQHGSHISIKNKTKQNQLWSQMIHTWIISALNNAGKPHITTRLLFPGKCTEAKQGHSLPTTEWRLDLGEEYRAAGSWDQGWTISHNAVLQ